MSEIAFLLLNRNLVAVPLQLGAGVVTIYCGARRASQLRGTKSGFASDARRPGFIGGATTARSEGGSKSNVGTRPPVAREITSHRSAGACPFLSHL